MKSFRKEQPPKDVKVLVRYMTYTGAVYDEMKYTTGPGGVSWFENDSGKVICKSSVTHWDYMSNQKLTLDAPSASVRSEETP
jgi:hypothetical protein